MEKLRKINLWKLKWIDVVDLSNDKKLEILKQYNFHELDIEATLEENQFPRVNKQDDYIFLIIHFPKYIPATWTYIINEFNIFLWKDFLLTFRDYHSSHINKIFDLYKNKEIKEDEKINPWYILYEIIQVMLEKMFKVIYTLKKDLKYLEDHIFKDATTDEVKTILIKKRNIVFLKHIFQPQVVLLRQLENELNIFFKWEYELYFEDLEDKIDFIVNQINPLYERIENIEDAFRSIIDIKLNKTMALLTIFSALMLPLTLITSFYGMNVPLPYQNNSYFVYWLLFICTIIMFIWLYLLKKKKII